MHALCDQLTASAMALIPVVLVAMLCTSADVACSQSISSFSKQPTVIRGYNGTCPLQEITKQTRQSISNELRNILPCRYSRQRDCQQLLDGGCHTSGVYVIQPDDREPFEVYCDMETDGGGWTVFQRRQDGGANFFRGTAEYIAGFGDLNGEFWLGLEAIHRLVPTQSDRTVTTLRVDLSDSQGNPGNATFETFGLLNSDTQYELSVARYSGGNAGDSLTQHTGSRFFTVNNDVGHPAFGADCANQVKGAWWFHSVQTTNTCHQFSSHLNGLFTPVSGDQRSGIQWRSFTGGQFEALSFSEMKLRRRIQ